MSRICKVENEANANYFMDRFAEPHSWKAHFVWRASISKSCSKGLYSRKYLLKDFLTNGRYVKWAEVEQIMRGMNDLIFREEYFLFSTFSFLSVKNCFVQIMGMVCARCLCLPDNSIFDSTDLTRGTIDAHRQSGKSNK